MSRFIVKVEHKFEDPRMHDMTTYVSRTPGRTAGIEEAAEYNSLKQAVEVAQGRSFTRNGHERTGSVVDIS